MLRFLLTLSSLAGLLAVAHAQLPTSMEVYNILQAKCATCHNGNEAPAGLDLQGAGANDQARALDVFNNIFRQTPANSSAAAKGDFYIYPGRPDRSFLFRKMNAGLEATVTLNQDTEGQSMPPYGEPTLTNVEKELIRQWILYGAPATGTVVDPALLAEYYSGNGLASFPDGPPEPPAAGEGFQFKMGPFFLPPGEELEYFQKYELDLPGDVEINRLDMQIGTYSHHLILYDFGTNGSNAVTDGLRLAPYHANISLVSAIQEATDLKLPTGTAFRWPSDLVLDMNSHYINYSATMVHQAEVYVNVYTQDMGTAAQEMFTTLIVKDDIYIPNNENTITFNQVVNQNLGQIYLWGLMGHTHKYGTSYKVWKRQNFQPTDLLYDAACARGIPGCVAPYFDYRHIPFRYFEPLQPLTMNFPNGMTHQASWINNGPAPVWFGPTSDDEMMVLVAMYTLGSEGIEIVDTQEPLPQTDVLEIRPAPAKDQAAFTSPEFIRQGTLTLFDLTGRPVWQQSVSGTQFLVQRGAWPAGMYSYQLQTSAAKVYTGKMLWLD
jgi:hypothetical protein